MKNNAVLRQKVQGLCTGQLWTMMDRWPFLWFLWSARWQQWFHVTVLFIQDPWQWSGSHNEAFKLPAFCWTRFHFYVKDKNLEILAKVIKCYISLFLGYKTIKYQNKSLQFVMAFEMCNHEPIKMLWQKRTKFIINY